MQNLKFSLKNALSFTLFTFLLISLLSLLPSPDALWGLIVHKLWIAAIAGILFGFVVANFKSAD
ncbi:MAG: hypothetical protein WCR52_04880 [Bacteroidota bacterium]